MTLKEAEEVLRAAKRHSQDCDRAACDVWDLQARAIFAVESAFQNHVEASNEVAFVAGAALAKARETYLQVAKNAKEKTDDSRRSKKSLGRC